MNLSLLFNPGELIEKLAIKIIRRRRLKMLRNKPGAHLKPGHVDSLELLEIIAKDGVIKNNAVIFDIGSNTGTWTLLAKSIFPDAIIHAFEPLTNHVDDFRKNCSALTEIYLHQFCVGNENVNGIINVSSYSDASSLLDATPLEFKYYNISKEREEATEIKRLSGLIDDQLIPCPDVIKLDIQGFELEALKGIGKWMNSVSYIICEVSFKEFYFQQAQFLEIASYLEKFQLQVFAFGHNTPVGKELFQIDVLFKNLNNMVVTNL